MTWLHQIGDWCRELLLLIPRPVVRTLFVALPVAVLLWVLWLPRARAVERPGDSWAKNLKVWAALALLIQIAIYSLI